MGLGGYLKAGAGLSANSFFLLPKRCHWSDMFTGRLRSEIPPALVSERSLCSSPAEGPLRPSQGFFSRPLSGDQECPVGA